MKLLLDSVVRARFLCLVVSVLWLACSGGFSSDSQEAAGLSKPIFTKPKKDTAVHMDAYDEKD